MQIPYVPQQHCPRKGAALIANQKFENLKFLAASARCSDCRGHGSRYEVKHRIADRNTVSLTIVALRRARASTRTNRSSKANGSTR
jgi:excinuclease UvrABC ATPase subunit